MATNNQPFNKFTLFPKLPLELRLAIWALATPEPAVIQQHQTESGIRYLRKIPAVLHACRESRAEYLELDGDTEDVSKERRARAHPIYKLSFRTRSMRGPATFFCAEIDTFWGTEYTYVGPWGDRKHFLLLAKLDIVSRVTRLMVPVTIASRDNAWLELMKTFPRLQVVTMVHENWTLSYANIDFRQPGPHLPSRVKWNLAPEERGQLVMSGLAPSDFQFTLNLVAMAKAGYEKAKLKLPNVTFPEMLFRFHDQIIANEGIPIPKPKIEEVDEDDEPKPAPPPKKALPVQRSGVQELASATTEGEEGNGVEVAAVKKTRVVRKKKPKRPEFEDMAYSNSGGRRRRRH